MQPLMCLKATPPGMTKSPLGTSLRSLQAVRNSRSLETDDYQPADSQITYPASGLDTFLRNKINENKIKIRKKNILSSNMTAGKCYKSFACKTNNIHQLFSTEKSSSCWSPSLSAASRGSRGFFHSVKDSLDRASAVKRAQRSHSASPCRIPNPAKVHLSVHGRVYASPDRSSAIAWARGVPSTWR